MSAPRVLCKRCRKRRHSEAFKQCWSCDKDDSLTAYGNAMLKEAARLRKERKSHARSS